MVVHEITNKAEFEKAITENNMAVVHFYTEWVKQCGPMNTVMEELASQFEYKTIHFAKIQAEKVPEVSAEHGIKAVPTFLIYKDGVKADIVFGANPGTLTEVINTLAGAKVDPPSPSACAGTEKLEDTIKKLLRLADVMVFMKGSPSDPRCGFSRTLVGLLNDAGIQYMTFDILKDEDIRQGLKKFSNWPTYPQVYLQGELIGGLDIIQELAKTGELVSTLTPKD